MECCSRRMHVSAVDSSLSPSVRRCLSSCAANMGFSSLLCGPSALSHVPSWICPILVPPLGSPCSCTGTEFSSASPAAPAEAREHCQNTRGGRGSFSRLWGPFGNHHFPGNMFQMWSFLLWQPGLPAPRRPGEILVPLRRDKGAVLWVKD